MGSGVFSSAPTPAPAPDITGEGICSVGPAYEFRTNAPI